MMRALRVVLLLSVYVAAGVGGCWIHRVITAWEGAGHPAGRKLREQQILEQYARDMDAIFEKYGRVMTPECAAEQEEVRRETRRKLEELRSGK